MSAGAPQLLDRRRADQLAPYHCADEKAGAFLPENSLRPKIYRNFLRSPVCMCYFFYSLKNRFLEASKLGLNMVPKRIFLTNGVGKHRERLTSFELALRDAGIAAQNLVRVSSIFPPHCKLISRKEGVKYPPSGRSQRLPWLRKTPPVNRTASQPPASGWPCPRTAAPTAI